MGDGPSVIVKCDDHNCSMVGGEERSLFCEFRGVRFVMFIGCSVKIGFKGKGGDIYIFVGLRWCYVGYVYFVRVSLMWGGIM